MNVKRFAIIVSALTLLLLTGCEAISHKPINRLIGQNAQNGQTVGEQTAAAEYSPRIYDIDPTDTEIVIEAEKCTLNGNLKVEKKRSGYSGEGYVTGFYGGSADYLVIPVQIPASQHYNVTVCGGADKTVTNTVSVNDVQLGNFVIDSKEFFETTYYGVYMEKGSSMIQIDKGDGDFDIDYVKITNDSELYDEKFEIDATPVSSKNSYEVRDLLRYLKENYGENTLTGQFASSSKNLEIDMIYAETGRYPAIRFGDIGGYGEGEPPLESELKAAEDWDNMGGIVGYMWYWKSPGEKSSIYAEETDFDLKKAVTKQDISQVGIADLQDMCRTGKISQECLSLVEDIDAVAQGLDKLAELGIPVIWRPLHEAGGGWYWWGAAGADAYKWLYELMFKRMTKYFGLDNLIWVWNGQNEEYLVDSDMYDIAAMDIYLDAGAEYSSRAQQFRWLNKITESKKMLALSECSSFPDIDCMQRDRAVWSWFGLWFGEYLHSGTGTGSDYISKNDLIKMYNAENTITLDEYSMIYGGQMAPLG